MKYSFYREFCNIQSCWLTDFVCCLVKCKHIVAQKELKLHLIITNRVNKMLKTAQLSFYYINEYHMSIDCNCKQNKKIYNNSHFFYYFYKQFVFECNK